MMTSPRCSHRIARGAILLATVTLFAGCGPFPPPEPASTRPFQGDVDRYWALLVDVCVRGVTPEMRELYAAARKSVEAERYGGGAGSNFWGLKDPDAAYEDCRQSPGDGWD
jgi:hypothetical protein